MDTGSETNDTGGHREDDLSDLIRPTLLWLQDTVTMAMLQTRLKMLQGAVLACALGLLLWTSIFLYGSFYYSYMPTATYTTPVHYYYRYDTHTHSLTLIHPYSICLKPPTDSSFNNRKYELLSFTFEGPTVTPLITPSAPSPWPTSLS